MKIIILHICFVLFSVANGQDPKMSAPRLLSQHGNLRIFPGYNRNITLEVLGDSSCINIGPYNLLQTIKDVFNASRAMKELTRSFTLMQASVTRMDNIRKFRVRSILRRLDVLENDGNSTQQVPQRRIRLIRNNVNAVKQKVGRIEDKIRAAENNVACASNPCYNGGTCLETFTSYKCHCPSNWEGPQCATDVNECIRFVGTDLGCQNGATCLNSPGSYSCKCMSGWFGVHCRESGDGCEGGSSEEMCGHGFCVPQKNSKGYTCICDQGWTNDENSPACTKDVDECQQKRHPCSAVPFVNCFNTLGTYVCGSCPAGYSGNGYYCADIDECLIANGGCSSNPKVDCINTVGSRMCGECPPGYQGDGVRCTYVGACHVDNGGCHIFANCISNIGQWYVQCLCKPGYTGTGVGLTGCVPTAGGVVPGLPPNAIQQAHCLPNPCVHGTCHESRMGRQCICEARYTGVLCDQLIDPCASRPCMNGGSCLGDKVTGGYRCECTDQFTGFTCDTRTAECGGVRSMPEGRIVYPENNSTNYNHNSRCAWVIVTDSEKVLNVTFTKFNLETSADCLYDWLQIHDGPNSASHNIGRFCGNTLPMGGNIITTRNVLYLWFRSDQTVSNNGFELSWMTIDPICGGHINATSHGIIRSPGNPGKYPNNRDCRWVITAPLDKKIQLHFFVMQIELSPDCNYDYVAVYEGPTTDGQQLAKYCGNIHPAPIVIPSHTVLVYFHSDGATNDNGFQISYAVLEGDVGCGTTYKQETGEIVPPMSGDKYMKHVTCEYLIDSGTPDAIVKITFVEFELENSNACQFDYVAVYDGPTRESNIIGKYCGSVLPPVLTSSSSKVLIVFKSDHTFSGGGFRIIFQKMCYKEYEKSSDIITSPGYPEEYGDQLSCSYLIKAPLRNTIMLTFIDLDIESTPLCMYDYLKIHDGDDPTDSNLLGKYCGTEAPAELISTHNYMFMEFKTDSSVGASGFKVNYTTIATECGGITKDPSGTIEYPDAKDDKYQNNKNCQWIISAPLGYIIHLTKSVFELEASRNCFADHLDIINHDPVTGEQEVLGRFCGSYFPQTITSTKNVMIVKFESDEDTAGDGFSFRYTFSDVRKSCGGTFFSSNGEIASPGWPKEYPSKKECKWVIQAPNRQQVILNITKFDLEEHPACSPDYLELRNGGSEIAPLIGKYCGSQIPQTITSTTNAIYLHFRSGYSSNYGGFYITWDSTSLGCGGILTSHHGTISSPNFPAKYSHDVECFWRIKTSAGTAIQLTFSNLEMHSSCLFDNVEIFNGDDASELIGRYCTLDAFNAPIISRSNHVYIKYRSVNLYGGSRFMLNYFTVCNRTFTDLSGTIESPNFPNSYPDKVNCVWNITAPMGNKINITFSHFQLRKFLIDDQSTSLVAEDFLGIKDGKTANFTKIYSWRDTGTHFQSSSNSISINFRTYFGIKKNLGFRLEWAVDGCGGYLRHPSDTFTSPGYPSLYPTKTECHWIIEVEPGKSIDLTINDLDIEVASDCSADSLKVYNGPSESSPILLHLCGKHDANFNRITSTSNYLYVTFYSDGDTVTRGFKATYDTEYSKCGGRYKGSSGSFVSPNFPKRYENNMECLYYLEVYESHTMTLEFIKFDIARIQNCSDYVKVYDGGSPFSKLLGVYCGSGPVGPITSSSNKLTVEFKSNDNTNDLGFMANFSMNCGSNIITSSEGFVSLKHDSAYVNSKNCTWTITSEKLDEKVSLTITYLNFVATEKGSDCLSSIEVFSGPSITSPSIGKFCENVSPPTIVSRGNSLTIHADIMLSDAFSFHYSVLKTACGGNITSEMGIFTSPMYPESYPLNSNCVWIIIVSPGNRITLTFTKFKLEVSENCEQDYVEIREENGAGKLIGIYCDQVPTEVKSYKNLWVKFASDSEGTSDGFSTRYSYDTFTEIENQDTGTLVTPLYPIPYKRMNSLKWRLTVSSGGYITITFKELDIRKDAICLNFLTIYDGYDENAPSLGEFCGVEIPKPIKSTTNVVFIHLDTQILFQKGTLFKLEWTRNTKDQSGIKTTDCGSNGTIYMKPGGKVTIESPGYPHGYDGNLNCEWIFDADPSQHLIVKFNDVHLEDTMSCFADKVTIYNKDPDNGNWKEIGSPICRQNASDMDNILVYTTMKVVFSSDQYVNKSGFQADVFSDCGNTLTQSSGIIESINALPITQESMYGNCLWNIKVRNSRVITVEILVLNMSRIHHDCLNYVMIRDGGSEDSPLLGKGKYCDSFLPNETLVTSSNKLHVTSHLFRLRQSTFKLKFSEMSLPCGDTITLNDDLNSTEITSPNYPDVPHPYTECSWIFVGEGVHRLTLSIIDKFDLTADPGCTKEYIEIRDGGTERSSLLRQFCTKPERSFKSSQNVLYLKYVTDVDVPNSGFKARVSIDVCGGTLYGSSGKVLSPNSLSLAFVKSDIIVCEWYIYGPENHRVTINIVPEIFAFSLGDDCMNTSLQVFDISIDIKGNLTYTPVTNKTCGVEALSVTTFVNRAMVKYSIPKKYVHTDHATFFLSYNSSLDECGGDYEQPSGTLSIPRFAPSNIYSCWFKITVPKGRRIKLEITVNDEDNAIEIMKIIEMAFRIYDGEELYLPLFDKYNAKSLSGVFESSSNAMIVHMWLIPKKTMSMPYTFIYTSDKPTICDGKFISDEGVLSLPVADLHSYNCRYEYETNEEVFNKTIEIFRIDRNNTGCGPTDSVYMVLITTKTHDLLSRLCQKNIIFSPYKNTIIQIRNYNTTSYPGYNINYKVHPCGGVVTDIDDEDSIFRLPKTNITGPLHCVWLIKVPSRKFLKIQPSTIVFSSNCSEEYVNIRFGDTQSSAIVLHMCSSEPFTVKEKVMHNTHVWIEYQAENFSSNSVIDMKLSYIDEDDPRTMACGGDLSWYNAKRRVFSTPGYPNQYPEDKECEWKLTAEDGNRISLKFENRFFIETSQNCTKDYVEIFDYELKSWVSLGRHCGRILPPVINSTAGIMKVVFHSDDARNADGFQARWSQFCGSIFNVTRETQKLVSPGREKYGRNLECVYKLVTDNNVNMKFEYFELEAGVGRLCKFDNLTIASDRYMFENETFCGMRSPGEKRLPGPITMHFKTDAWISAKGFSLTFWTDTNRPDIVLVDHSKNTTYIVDVTIPHDENLQKAERDKILKYMDLAHEIKDMWRTPATIVVPIVISTNGLIPKSLHANLCKVGVDGGLKYLMQKAVLLSTCRTLYCGGNVTEAGTVFKAPRYIPGSMYNNVRCEWFIQAPENKSVILSFRYLTTEYVSGCTYENVEVYEGFVIADGNPIAKLCGNLTSSRTVIKTNGNKMAVLYAVFSYSTTPDFEAVITFAYDEAHGCGGLVNVTTTPTPLHIFSDRERYESYLDCHWIFKAPADHFVKIWFTEFNVSSCYNSTDIENCECDFLEVHDGVSSHSELIGRYCGSLLPDNITSTRNYLWTRFVSDGTVENSGIQIYAIAEPSICGSSLLNATKMVHELVSPGYSTGKLLKDIKCEWLIHRPLSEYIYFQFTDFNVGVKPLNGSVCDTEYVEIIYEKITSENEPKIMSGVSNQQRYYDYASMMTPPIRLCGRLDHFEESSLSTDIRIRLVTSNMASKRKGFKLEYKETECSVNLTKPYARVHSKQSNQPGDQCVVTITAPQNYTISLYIYLVYAYGSSCNDGYLEIFDGTVGGNMTSLKKLCVEELYTFKGPIHSHGNTMTFKFDATNFYFYNYNFAYVISDKGRACGGTFQDYYGRIYSPFYPESYRENKTCDWIIQSPASSVNVTFEFFDIGVTTTCEHNYVELIDDGGLSLVKYCQKTMPAPFVILNNYVKISYHTSTNNYGAGFVIGFAPAITQSPVK